MWDKIKALFRSILENGVFELVKALVLLIIIPTAGGLGTSILADFITVLQPYRIPLIILVVLIILFVVLCIYQRFSKKYPAFPPVNSDYSIMQREVSFQYGKTECSYEMKVRLRAKKYGINQYVGKYAWSGSARPIIKCIKSQHTYIELEQKDIYSEYQIMFNQNYRKGKTVECGIAMTLRDPAETFIPYFSTQVLEPTQRLIITLTIPPEYGVTEVIKEQLPGARNENSIAENCQLNSHGEIQWEIKDPKLFYTYSFRWKFP